jgi:hypothetical protein
MVAGKQLQMAKGLHAPFGQSFFDLPFAFFVQWLPAIEKHLLVFSFESMAIEGTGSIDADMMIIANMNAANFTK